MGTVVGVAVGLLLGKLAQDAVGDKEPVSAVEYALQVVAGTAAKVVEVVTWPFGLF